MAPLTRASVTAASRIMLPTYPIVLGYFGLTYTFGDANRYTSPSFEVAKDIMPIRTWGILFLLITSTLLIGYAFRSRDVTIFVLSMAAFALFWWGVFFAVAIFTVPYASLGAPAWPWFGMTACIATATSIAKRET